MHELWFWGVVGAFWGSAPAFAVCLKAASTWRACPACTLDFGIALVIGGFLAQAFTPAVGHWWPPAVQPSGDAAATIIGLCALSMSSRIQKLIFKVSDMITARVPDK